MKEYIERYDKTYLKCTSCKHFDGSIDRCKLFDVSCSIDDGCTEEHIKEEEIKRLDTMGFIIDLN